MSAGWRWIFLIEGLLTIVAAGIAYIFLPNDLETASFLTDEERRYAVNRLLADRPVARSAVAANHLASPHAGEHFQWSEVLRGVLSVQTWLSASAYFCILSGLYSFGLFTPSIITALGYSNTSAQVRLGLCLLRRHC